MQSLSLLLLSFSTLVATNGGSTSTCTLGYDICPTGSSCSLTTRCGGLCFTPFSAPPVIPCTLGNNGPCLPSSTCTPTMVCPTGAPCGGQCLATSFPPYNNSSLPSITCSRNDDRCPTGSFCSQTEVCNGLCVTASATVTATPTPTATVCGGTQGRQCDKGYKCIAPDGKHCGAQPGCYGICQPH